MLDEKLKNSVKEPTKSDEIDLSKFLSSFEFLNNGETKYYNLIIDLSETETLKKDLEDLLNNPELFNLEQSITYKNKQQLGNFLFSKVLSKDFDFDDDMLTDLIASIPLEKSVLLVYHYIYDYYINLIYISVLFFIRTFWLYHGLIIHIRI